MKLCLRCNQYFDDSVDNCPSDGAILENVGKDPLIGALINNRYLVDSVIGKGSSGIVYKARRLGRGEMVVAIKVLHSYIGAAGSALDRFLREAQAASMLRNPHIITIWESGVTEDGQPYFVMDYLEGTTLGYLIKERANLEPKRVLSLLHQICEALAEAHRVGIVHRDLKPENIVLQESGHGHDYVKLLDFGIADSPEHSESSYKLEKPRTVSGSPAYMSPEQCQGLEIDGRSDIYSLAIVVFEMLTGCRPFSQQDNVNIMVLHVNEPPMSLSEVRPDLRFPQEVENVIARALSKQPEERQASVQDFLLEFELAWQSDENPLRVIAKAAGQASNSTNSLAANISPNAQQDIVTSDDLAVENGELLSPVRNMPASEPIAKPPVQPITQPVAQFVAMPVSQPIAVPTASPFAQTMAVDNSQLTEQPKQPTEQPIAQSSPQQAGDQQEQFFSGKNKTVERLMEAAKRGQTYRHKSLGQGKLPVPPVGKLPANNVPNTLPSNMPGSVSGGLPSGITNNIANNISVRTPAEISTPIINNVSQDINQNIRQTPPSSSGWFAVQHKETIPTTPSRMSTFSAESTALDATFASSPSSSPFIAPFTEPITAPSLSDEEQLKDSSFYIKQKYRTTLSRLGEHNKPRQADISLITTRARAAALKADVTKPPINLWHIAIATVVSACLFASIFVVYSAVTMSPLPESSIDTLLKSGNYQQVTDILEGKKLSDPLTDIERDQLSMAYLNLAKADFSKSKDDRALASLVKIDPKSPSATEGTELKNLILQSKKSTVVKP